MMQVEDNWQRLSGASEDDNHKSNEHLLQMRDVRQKSMGLTVLAWFETHCELSLTRLESFLTQLFM